MTSVLTSHVTSVPINVTFVPNRSLHCTPSDRHNRQNRHSRQDRHNREPVEAQTSQKGPNDYLANFLQTVSSRATLEANLDATRSLFVLLLLFSVSRVVGQPERMEVVSSTLDSRRTAAMSNALRMGRVCGDVRTRDTN